MFKQSTIDAVFNLDLVTVIKAYVPDLKKQGANWHAKSPFTEEKSPSFVVSPAKNVFKCFSTGKGGGNPVRFIQELHNVDFKQSINELATKFGIEIEIDDSRGVKNLEAAKKRATIFEANRIAQDFFESFVIGEDECILDAPNEEMQRQLSRARVEEIRSFQIGLSHPKASLKDYLMNNAIGYDVAIEAGLLNKREDENGIRYTNPFHNRITFPILDRQNRIVGFSARAVNDEQKPKVINTKETAVFSKSNILLGLNLAWKEAGRLGEMIKVEGNFDVTAFHSVGMINTVAKLGSAFTAEQAKEIKKYCNHIVLAIDNDKAGLKKVQPDVENAISNGLTVELWVSDVDGEDPFDFFQRMNGIHSIKSKKPIELSEIIEFWKSLKCDAIDWLANSFFEGKTTILEKTDAQKKLCSFLAKIKDGTLRNNYVKEYAKTYGVAKSDVETAVSTIVLQERAKEEERATSHGHRLPTYLSKEEIENFNEYRFYADTKGPKTCGYHFAEGESMQHVSNFVIKPLFKIEHFDDSDRIAELVLWSKGREKKCVIKLSNNSTVAIGDFKRILANHNAFFSGSAKQYDRLIRKIADEFIDCKPIKTLGWQRNGFFAFANGIIKDGWQEVNNYGICIANDTNFFLPAFSDVYKALAADDEDPYENDRLFVYSPSKITFEMWAKQFNTVYADQKNGMFGIAFLCATLFSDWIFHRNDNSFPIFFGYGLPQTGKSTMGRSLSKVFRRQVSEFNLNSGTVNAFQRKLARARNVIEHLDEYRNDIDEKRFQGLKGFFDRTGHEKATLSRDNRTETTKPISAAYISGQDMPTRDQMALLTRTILRNFTKQKDKYTNHEANLFLELGKMEEQGLSNVILEIIRYRNLVEEKFGDVLYDVNTQLKDELRNESVEGRISQNYAVLCTIVKVLQEVLKFPFTYSEIYEESKTAIIKQSELAQESNEFAEFLKMVQFLILDYKLSYQDDYIIKEIDQLMVREGKENRNVVLKGDGPQKVIFLNFAKTYPLYNQYHRSQKGLPGIPETGLKEYMKAHKSFIGAVAAMRFGKQTTSAYAFYYDELPIQIGIDQTPIGANNEVPKENQTGNYHTDAIASQGFGTQKDDDLPF